MDIYGFTAIIIGVIGYLALRNKSEGWAKFFLWVSGVGVGIVIAAVWSLFIIDRVFGGFGF